MGEADGADSVDDGTGGVRDVVGDGIASGLGVEEMMGTACALGSGEMTGTACALGVEEMMGTACALGVEEVMGDLGLEEVMGDLGLEEVMGTAWALGVEEVMSALGVEEMMGTACALGVDLGAAAAVAPASVVDWGIVTALGAVLTVAFASAILGKPEMPRGCG